VIAAAVVAFAGVATGLVAVLWAGHEHRAAPAPPATVPAPAPPAYVPCHTTMCGHMTVPHDRSAAGLTCRGCGTTREEGTHA
jgi:hypothetical protein